MSRKNRRYQAIGEAYAQYFGLPKIVYINLGKLKKVGQRAEGRFAVYGSGHRSSHGCTASLLLEGEVERINKGDNLEDFAFQGKVIEIEPCSRCREYAHLRPGDTYSGRGWYDPGYYGHVGIQE